MKRSWLIRGAALGAGAILLAGVLAPNLAQVTSAGWSDAQAASATMSALTVPGVERMDCTNTTAAPTSATLSWPAVSDPGVEYQLVSTNSKGQTTVTTQSETSKLFKRDILESILGILLQESTILTIDVRVSKTYGGTQWLSPSVVTRRLDFQWSLLGLTGGFKCLPPS